MGVKWTCPFCGKSQTNRSDDEYGEENAIAALRSHIVAADGDGHGPRYDLPDSDPVDLTEHVVGVNERRAFE